MAVSIAHLGPSGTNAETAALAFSHHLTQSTGQSTLLCPYSNIGQTLRAVAQGDTQMAVVPVENSIEGIVTITLDTLWQFDQLQIQQALVLPIVHALLSRAKNLETIKTVYSHPQALAQCQEWLEKFLPNAQLIANNSTTEALQLLDDDLTIAAIASPRAAQLYNLPMLAHPINDYPGNCTRFWVLSLDSAPSGTHTSLGFSVAANVPGALVKPLQVLAERGINLSRIESRPTKRSLGDYLFFMDFEADLREPSVQAALVELKNYTETLKIFGSYSVKNIQLETLSSQV
ncbi:prephenate dehydratase [Trichocoleus sp. FACHB-591]|uniref:prephenate dehydratase n=1 Tax=Trichocoleus sp. FACHB-591 TaxID=2692872 RepID=UPI001688FF78|nr:prephenate dehydratase [Trichocoleus sp. FACHB-591]MBD2096679.1 prephenate dehydratase [Trichocoleus sp. FACHB-591]